MYTKESSNPMSCHTKIMAAGWLARVWLKTVRVKIGVSSCYFGNYLKRLNFDCKSPFYFLHGLLYFRLSIYCHKSHFQDLCSPSKLNIHNLPHVAYVLEWNKRGAHVKVVYFCMQYTLLSSYNKGETQYTLLSSCDKGETSLRAANGIIH